MPENFAYDWEAKCGQLHSGMPVQKEHIEIVAQREERDKQPGVESAVFVLGMGDHKPALLDERPA